MVIRLDVVRFANSDVQPANRVACKSMRENLVRNVICCLLRINIRAATGVSIPRANVESVCEHDVRCFGQMVLLAISAILAVVSIRAISVCVMNMM
jgi:hypothetical protein